MGKLVLKVKSLSYVLQHFLLKSFLDSRVIAKKAIHSFMLDYIENVFSDGASGGARKQSKSYWERTDEELTFDHNDAEEDQELNMTRNHLRSFSFFRLLLFDHPSAEILLNRIKLGRIQNTRRPYNSYGYENGKIEKITRCKKMFPTFSRLCIEPFLGPLKPALRQISHGNLIEIQIFT